MRYLFVILMAALVAGCATPERVVPQSKSRTSVAVDRLTPAGLTSSYVAAVADARYPRPSKRSVELTPLLPSTPGLRWDTDGRVLMASWTRMTYYSGDKQPASGDVMPLFGETWFTVVPRMRDFCSATNLADQALQRRLEQRLGLPPFGDYDAFLEVWVSVVALIRPCTDREVTDASCDLGPPLSVTSDTDEVSWQCPALVVAPTDDNGPSSAMDVRGLGQPLWQQRREKKLPVDGAWLRVRLGFALTLRA